ncbi:MAG: Maf family nucleotide pyrophosphatase [Cyclobacteriaceae bacterium]|jgi:septum formation protein
MINLRYPLILASNSPRRQQILREAGFEFTIRTLSVNEDFPESMKVVEVPAYLARKKAEGLLYLSMKNIILSADTIVVCNDRILGKPESPREAIEMLTLLSGKSHRVYTGVCIAFKNQCKTIVEKTEVKFKDLNSSEIDYYIKHFAPMDKAGAYGIQEWIGLIGITGITGSYLNVVGLPVAQVYNTMQELNLITG